MPRRPPHPRSEPRSRSRSGHPKVFVSIGLGFGFSRDIVAGIVAYAREHGPWEFVGRVDPVVDTRTIERFASYDGVIFHQLRAGAVKAILKRRTPAVSVGGGAHDPAIHHVTSDGPAIARMAYDYFRELGFTRFAVYGGYPGGRAAMVQAFRALTDAAGHGFTDLGPVIRRTGPANRKPLPWNTELKQLKKRLPELGQRVALFTCSTEDARPVVAACDELGIKVPDEVAVLGVDDDEAICELASPPISSIDHGCEQIGWEAARRLDQLMRGERPARTIVHVPPVRVVARQSTNTLAVDDPIVVRALEFMQAHFGEQVTVGEVMDHVGVSRPTLEQHFQHTLGHTVHRHLTNVRIQHAKELLQATPMELTAISVRCGFSYPSRFSTAFRREVGMSPSAFRDKHMIRRKI